MTPEQMQTLTEKVTGWGYPEPDIEPGEEDVLMLHVCDHFICGALYALSMPDAQLQALIAETVAGGQD
jgi:hypothetical protein